MESPPCLVYCHSQTGNRLEGYQLLEYCATKSMSLLLFDFAACGKSQGEYLSLGWFESLDLDVVIRDLKSRFRVSSVSLWGRSMGAVTCILYAEQHQAQISFMVLDSPFSNLKEMLIKIGQNKVKMPAVVLSMALTLISSTINQKLGVDLLSLEPGKTAEKCNVPAVFIVAKNDEILPPKSVLDIYERYKSTQKAIIYSLEGTHNTEREEHIIEQAFGKLIDHITKKLYEQKMSQKTEHPVHNRGSVMMEDPFFRPNAVGGKSHRETSLNSRRDLNSTRVMDARRRTNAGSGLLERQHTSGLLGGAMSHSQAELFQHGQNQYFNSGRLVSHARVQTQPAEQAHLQSNFLSRPRTNLVPTPDLYARNQEPQVPQSHLLNRLRSCREPAQISFVSETTCASPTVLPTPSNQYNSNANVYLLNQHQHQHSRTESMGLLVPQKRQQVGSSPAQSVRVATGISRTRLGTLHSLKTSDMLGSQSTQVRHVSPQHAHPQQGTPRAEQPRGFAFRSLTRNDWNTLRQH